MVGDRIKAARLKLGYSAEQVAAYLGISPATVYRYENGDIAKLPSKHIKPLAKFLCVSPSYLMEWSESEEPPRQIELSPDDQALLSSYRSLPPSGKNYLQQQIQIAKVMFHESCNPDGFKKED